MREQATQQLFASFINDLDRIIIQHKAKKRNTILFERIRDFIQLNTNEEEGLLIIEVFSNKLLSMAALDFSNPIELNQEKDFIGFVSTGLNMVCDELKDKTIPKYFLNSLDAISDCVALTNEKGIIIHVNELFSSLFEIPKESLINIPIWSLFVSDKLSKLVSSGKKLEMVNTNVFIQGEKTPMTFTVTELMDEENETLPKGYLFIAKPFEFENISKPFII